ncbi:MAG: DUF4366 domain-containing protein [Eubacterium sp.]
MCKIRFRAQPVLAALMFTAVLAGSFPVTAFANTGKEADCICETKCTEEDVNDECPVCTGDITLCQGTEPEKEEEPAEETTEPETESEGPLTPDGNMNLVDDYGDHETSGKQFITLTTKNGNYFYLIIDRDDSGNETVHFLNQVDEADLLSLMDEDAVKEYTASQEAENQEKEESSTAASEEPEPDPQPEETETVKKQTKVPVGTLLLLVLVGFAVIGAYVYKKVGKKNRKDDQPDPDADYREGEEEDYLSDLEEEDTPMKEEDADSERNASDAGSKEEDEP